MVGPEAAHPAVRFSALR